MCHESSRYWLRSAFLIGYHNVAQNRILMVVFSIPRKLRLESKSAAEYGKFRGYGMHSGKIAACAMPQLLSCQVKLKNQALGFSINYCISIEVSSRHVRTILNIRSRGFQVLAV